MKPFISKPENLTSQTTWQEVPDTTGYDNAFKIQWEEFLKHGALGTPFPWTLREGAKGVQLAELGLQSWEQRKWLPAPDLVNG